MLCVFVKRESSRPRQGEWVCKFRCFFVVLEREKEREWVCKFRCFFVVLERERERQREKGCVCSDVPVFCYERERQRWRENECVCLDIISLCFVMRERERERESGTENMERERVCVF